MSTALRMRQSAERSNGNLSHETPRSQTGSLRVEGSDGEGTYNWTPRPTPISFLIQERWVFLERTQILSGIQFTTHFIELFVVETKRFVGSFVNVILTRQTCATPNNDCSDHCPASRAPALKCFRIVDIVVIDNI